MSDISSILERARKYASKVERLERALANEPSDRKIQLELASLRRLAEETQAAFENISAKHNRDIVRYRIENRNDNYFISSLSESCVAFQNVITAICDSLVHGPKTRGSFSEEISQATALQFSYTFPGSVGFVLSIENERNLFSGKLDDTIDAFRQIIEIDHPDAAKDASRTLGLAAISSFGKWVDVNVKWNNNINYIWKRSDGVDYGQFISVDKFAEIREILHGTEDIESSILQINGVLVGLDLKDAKFHLVEPEGDTYKGGLSEDFPRSELPVGKYYQAQVKYDIIRNVATGKENIRHTLLKISEI